VILVALSASPSSTFTIVFINRRIIIITILIFLNSVAAFAFKFHSHISFVSTSGLGCSFALHTGAKVLSATKEAKEVEQMSGTFTDKTHREREREREREDETVIDIVLSDI
jgi:hypothetical protein